MTTKTLQVAMDKASRLPEAAQEQIGLEVIERVEAFARLRELLDVGVRELDAGLGQELDIEQFLQELNAEHGKR